MKQELGLKQYQKPPGIVLECEKCGNIWTYRGAKKTYASCTDCRNPVRIQENKIESPHPVKSGQLSQSVAVPSTSPGEDEPRHG